MTWDLSVLLGGCFPTSLPIKNLRPFMYDFGVVPMSPLLFVQWGLKVIRTLLWVEFCIPQMT